jgi:protein-tyrosine phosphatase
LKHILFVCTGNTCRSSMAQSLFETALTSDSTLTDHFTADSAGLAAFRGDPASENSVKAVHALWNIDLHSHRAKQMDDMLASSADLILTMTQAHRDAIFDRFPQCRKKCFTLKEYIYDIQRSSNTSRILENIDISDPYGLPLDAYIRCAQDMKRTVDKLIEKLKNERL